MISIIFFVWIGIKLSMPPMWFFLCGVCVFAWLISTIAKIVKFIQDE